MAVEFYLDIVTPSKNLFSGNVVSVTVPGSDGMFQVLANHAPLLSSLSVGVASVELADKTVQRYGISGGFFEVSANKAMLLVESAS